MHFGSCDPQAVTYFCHSGYTLRGMKTISCLTSGKWSAAFPKCCRKRSDGNFTSGGGIPGSTLDVFEQAAEKRVELANPDQVSCSPLERTKSVDFECRTPNGEISNCGSLPLPPYTVAHLKCAQ